VSEDITDDFDQFFYRLLPSVMRVARRIVADQSTAEDVSAEAFARAFASWSKVAKLSYRDAWVLRVATNLALDQVKQRRAVLAEPQASEDPAEVAVNRQLLTDALRSLPRRQRQAVVLRYLADLPEDEVGQAIGVRRGTVKAHLQRGREALRLRIDFDPEELGYGSHSV
jgi:RNA polymerase sigma factor (sigma-70 family)